MSKPSYEPGKCPAVLNLKGEHFDCDRPADTDGNHHGWAHSNKAAQTLWSDGAA